MCTDLDISEKGKRNHHRHWATASRALISRVISKEVKTRDSLGIGCTMCVVSSHTREGKKESVDCTKERKKERQQHYHRVDVYNIQYQQAGSLSLESRVYVGCVMSDSMMMMMMMIVGGVDTMVERERVRDSQLFLARKVGKFHSSMLEKPILAGWAWIRLQLHWWCLCLVTNCVWTGCWSHSNDLKVLRHPYVRWNFLSLALSSALSD